MNSVLQDLRYTFRMLGKRPGLTLLAVLALGLGMGANTALFSVVNAVLLRPLPYPEPDRLVSLLETTPQDAEGSAVSAPNFVDWAEQSRSLEGLAAFRSSGFNLVEGDAPERVDAAVVSSNFFEVLGVRPLLGRTFDAARPPGGPRSVVLGESLWRRRFGADPRLVGRSLSAHGESFTVVGVMPAAFQLPAQAELWVEPALRVPEHPLRPTSDPLEQRDSHYLDVVGRLRPGVSLAQAQSELDVIARRLAGAHPESNRDRGIRSVSLREQQVARVRPLLLVLLGAVAFILLIACANVAHLRLAQALSRQHEVAIRLALGATRGQLVRLFFLESLVLALLGGGLGLLLGLWGAPPLVALGPSHLRTEELGMDGRVLAFTTLLCVTSALLFGLVPALSQLAPSEALKDAGRNGSAGLRRSRLRSALVVAEVALSLVLLVGAGLMVRSFARLASVAPGFDPEGVLTADLSLPSPRYADSERQRAFFRDVLRELQREPEVVTVGATSRLPLAPGNSGRGLLVEGRPPDEELSANIRVVSPDYFAALRIPLKEGRGFTEADGPDAPRVVVINEALARLAWPGQSALGKRLTMGVEPMEVVGVVGDVHQARLDVAPRPEFYVPAQVEPWPFMTLVVRGRVPPAQLVRAVERSVHRVDSEQPLTRVMSMDERVSLSLEGRRFSVLLLGLFAAVALVLAVTGIYGVLAYSVGQRTRELGIRMALGASPGSVLGMVTTQAMGLVLGGILLGVGGALPLTRVLQGFLYGIPATDPLTFAGVSALLGLTAATACLAAARRATRVDPTVALRSE